MVIKILSTTDYTIPEHDDTFSVEEKGSAETIEKRWKQLIEDFRNPTANRSIIIGDKEK